MMPKRKAEVELVVSDLLSDSAPESPELSGSEYDESGSDSDGDFVEPDGRLEKDDHKDWEEY